MSFLRWGHKPSEGCVGHRRVVWLVVAPPNLASVLALADQIRKGEVTATQAVEASLARIQALQPTLNAFTQVRGDQALGVAAQIQTGDPRPFAGVPIVIKDLFSPIAGWRQSQGSALFGDWTPDYDAFVVRRFKRAGCVIVATTNTPEFGLVATTEPSRFGPTRNPWNLERTAGGSSGGSGAAVAAGMVPAAHGSDGGGSIRIPAACCGLVGLKPSRGRISSGPDLGDAFLASDGVLTHSVADTAALLDVMAGYEWGDTNWAPPPNLPFAQAAIGQPGRLRIRLVLTPPIDTSVDPMCVDATHKAADMLSDLGHQVQEGRLPWSAPDGLELFKTLWTVGASFGVAFGGLMTGRSPRQEDVEAFTWAMHSQGERVDAVSFLASVTRLQAIGRQVVAEWEHTDLVLTPALAKRPLTLGEIDTTSSDANTTFYRAAEFTPFTPIVNVTGQPAISLPLFHGDDGLPLGIQLIGAPAGEARLLAVASQLEVASPWADRRPPLP